MPEIVLCNASPHVHGVCDAIMDCLVQIDSQVQPLVLRRETIAPCQGCRSCSTEPFACPLDTAGDTAKDCLLRLAKAKLLLFCAPIYFYALPAMAKALIDRSQRFYTNPLPTQNSTTLVLLTAARNRGEQLFTGSLLTLHYFFAQLGRTITQAKTVRGLDLREDFLHNGSLQKELTDWFGQWLRKAQGQHLRPKREVS